MNCDLRTLDEAIVVWSGWGVSPWPARDDRRIVEKFGDASASKLLQCIHQMEADFTDPELGLMSLSYMKWARWPRMSFVPLILRYQKKPFES